MKNAPIGLQIAVVVLLTKRSIEAMILDDGIPILHANLDAAYAQYAARTGRTEAEMLAAASYYDHGRHVRKVVYQACKVCVTHGITEAIVHLQQGVRTPLYLPRPDHEEDGMDVWRAAVKACPDAIKEAVHFLIEGIHDGRQIHVDEARDSTSPQQQDFKLCRGCGELY